MSADPPDFERISAFTALRAAALCAAKACPRARATCAFLAELESEVLSLQRELRAGVWRPAPVHTFTLRDPKVRTITASAFRDRVVHHALCAELSPIWERSALPDSFACRAGYGNRAAVARAQEYARKYGWFVKLDVRRYFETLPHGPLLARLGTDIEDPRILALFEIILEMGANGPGRGIPIGALTSQHLGNYYLDRLDAWARDTARIPALVRYMDDILVFGETRADARVFRDSLSAFLHDDLELTVKHEVTVLGPTRIGIPFLGFRVHADRVRFDRARKRRWWENMREIDRRILVEGEDESLLVRRAGSLVGWAEQADTIGLRHSFLEHRARSPVAGYG